MCWKSSNIHEFIEATKDIEVRKVVKHRKALILSMYQDFEYSLGKSYKVDDCIIKRGPSFWCGNEGFHSYAAYVKIHRNFLNDIVLVTTNEGDVIDSTWDPSGNLYVLHCTIPKGAKYCVNEWGEIISDSIIPNSIEEIVW